MKRWLAILLFAGLTFLSLGIKPFIENETLSLILGSSHYIYILLILYFSRIKERVALKVLFFLMVIIYFVLDLLVFFNIRTIHNLFVMSVNLTYIISFFLCFILVFKKFGSGFYTKNKSDWTVGFPVGLASFIILLSLYYGRVQPKFDPHLILFGSFISLFYVLGVNTPLKLQSYIILLFGLFLNFLSVNLAIYEYQIESIKNGHLLMKGVFFVSYYCLLESTYHISEVLSTQIKR